ncbi:alpha/beta hydrolase [Ascidiimonas aurantiaca]|uniref:alpha/beta hydrolase n=1 Tax=Ascidiimonas aurantiaca TaxID=1685432 RepID=UPI0030EC607E
MTKFISILFFLAVTFLSAQERYIDSVFSNIHVETMSYIQKDGISLDLDFYQPVKDTLSKRPLFVFVHGGGFSSGKRDHKEIVKLAYSTASRGYAVASLSYRLTRKGKSFSCDCPASEKIETFRAVTTDILDALLFLVNQKEKLQIDEQRIILAGSSAGAEGILIAAYNREVVNADKKYAHIKPAVVVSLAGALLDIRYITKENAVPGVFFHGTADPLVPYDSAPHHYCEQNTPGYIMLDGSATIVKKLEDLDQSFLFYSFKGAGHNIFKIPFDRMQEIYFFIDQVVNSKKLSQTRILLEK